MCVRVSLQFRLGPRAPGVSVRSRNPVRKRVDACGLGGRAWMAPCRLRVRSCLTCTPGYLVLGRIYLYPERGFEFFF